MTKDKIDVGGLSVHPSHMAAMSGICVIYSNKHININCIHHLAWQPDNFQCWYSLFSTDQGENHFQSWTTNPTKKKEATIGSVTFKLERSH